MDEMKGVAALKTAETVTKTGGTFTIVFFPYSRAKRPNGPVNLKKFEGCTMRKPLPHEKFDIDGKHFFLFNDAEGKPKACYRALIRFMAFSTLDNKLKKITWYE